MNCGDKLLKSKILKHTNHLLGYPNFLESYYFFTLLFHIPKLYWLLIVKKCFFLYINCVPKMHIFVMLMLNFIRNLYILNRLRLFIFIELINFKKKWREQKLLMQQQTLSDFYITTFWIPKGIEMIIYLHNKT